MTTLRWLLGLMLLLGSSAWAQQGAIQELSDALHSPDTALRVQAAQQLAVRAVGDPAAVDVLLSALHDSDSQIRMAAAVALGTSAQDNTRVFVRNIVPAATAALRDGDAEVRVAAAFCLQCLGPQAAVAWPALQVAATDPSPLVRAAVARALPAVGVAAGQVVPILLRLLRDAENAPREEAAGALAQMGAAAAPAQSVLMEALRDSDLHVRVAAAECLARMHVPQAVAVLTDELADRNETVRRLVIGALGRAGPAAREALPALVERLRDRDADKEAAAAIQHIGAMAALPMLLPLLQDSSVAVRLRVTDALAGLGEEGKAAAPALREALNDSNGTVRIHAAACLWSVARDRAVLPILVKGLRDDNFLARHDAALALATMGADAVPAVAALFDSLADSYAAPAAAYALTEIAPQHPRIEEAVPGLLWGLLRESSPFAYAVALWRLDTHAASAIEPLLAILRSSRDTARLPAAAALLRIDAGNEEARANLVEMMPLMLHLLEMARSSRLTLFLVDSLGRMGAAAQPARPALTQLLQNGDASVRDAASRALRLIGNH